MQPLKENMLKPTRGYVIILPDEAEEKTASGLYVPDKAQEKPQKGTVIAVGAKRAVEPSPFLEWVEPEVKKGDKVYYRRWGGDEIKEDGKEYKIVKFDDIIAIIE